LDETKGAYQNVGFKSLFWDADTIENRILKNILWKFLWQCDLDWIASLFMWQGWQLNCYRLLTILHYLYALFDPERKAMWIWR